MSVQFYDQSGEWNVGILASCQWNQIIGSTQDNGNFNQKVYFYIHCLKNTCKYSTCWKNIYARRFSEIPEHTMNGCVIRRRTFLMRRSNQFSFWAIIFRLIKEHFLNIWIVWLPVFPKKKMNFNGQIFQCSVFSKL